MTPTPRTIAWFSCGAASAVVAKLLSDQADAAGRMPDGSVLDVVYIRPGRRGAAGGEHPDNARFLADVQRWIGRGVTVLCNARYQDHLDACLTRGYIKGTRGALCTRELKVEQREAYQRPGDVHCFGYTLDERDRADAFNERNPDLVTRWPLIEAGLAKADCLGLLWKAGIEIPVMYRQGYDHNNCVGCVKGGMGYWNRIRRDYPEAFAAWAEAERLIGASILKEDLVVDGQRASRPVYLDELDPERGDMSAEPPISCGLTCQGLTLSPAPEVVATDA